VIVADLVEILRAEVVVIQLVPMVVVGVARVGIEEVEIEQEAQHRDGDADASRGALGHGVAEFFGALLEHQQPARYQRHADRYRDREGVKKVVLEKPAGPVSKQELIQERRECAHGWAGG
jgi:hypothetical protein